MAAPKTYREVDMVPWVTTGNTIRHITLHDMHKHVKTEQFEFEKHEGEVIVYQYPVDDLNITCELIEPKRKYFSKNTNDVTKFITEMEKLGLKSVANNTLF